MNKKSTIIISLLLVLLFVLPLTAYGVSQSDIDKVQAEREELAVRQQQSQSKIEQLKEQQASVIEQKKALDERNTIAAEQLALIQEQIALYHTMIDEKALEVDAARETEEEQLQRLRLRVRAMEENGGYDMLALLMSADSVSDLLSAMDDIGQIMEADRMLEDNYIAARESHEQTKSEYEALLSELEVRESEYLKEQAELEKMIEEATDLIASLEADIEQAQREYEEAERARAAADYQISMLIAEINRQNQAAAEQKSPKPAETPSEPESQTEPETSTEPETQSQPTEAPSSSDATPAESAETPAEPAETPSESETSSEPETTPAPAADPEPTPAQDDGIVTAAETGVVGSGSLEWPVPSGHVVTSRYGMRIHPITGEEKFHSGMDIDGYNNEGGAIVACDDGVVVKAEWYGGYGNCIIIDHGNGMQTLYGHMSGFAVSEGDTVSKGQTIGYLGSTGVATGTHCHLEVFVNGGRVDPAGYFSGITYYDC